MFAVVLVALTAATAGDAGPPAARETGLYRLQLAALRTCDQPAAMAADARPGRTWMGFEVRAVAKVDELFVTARDFSLEMGGIVVQARHVDPPLLGGCQPLLPHKQLRARQNLRGFVLFEVPARLRTGDAPVRFVYRPTRWGGGPRVEFPLAPCLGSCAGGSRQAPPTSDPAPARPAKS
jgi:hypothetical protein